MKVSVIVPVYNGEHTIAQCIRSLLDQTLSEMEIIVVNDGSTDGTREILEQYKDRIKILNQNRQGQGNARNLGISHAGGQYVGFVDADDTVERDMFQVLYHTATLNRAQIVQCAIRDVRENGTVSVRGALCEHVNIQDTGAYVYAYFYKQKHTNEVCNKLIERAFLQEHRLTFGDTALYFSEDFKLNMEMLLHLERISFVEKPLYNYYIKQSGHCLHDANARIEKILYLFECFFQNRMEQKTRDAFGCVAALTLLMYCAQAPDTSGPLVQSVLRSKALREYIRASGRCKKTLKHRALCAMLLYMPMRIKLFLLKKFYIF